MTLINNTFNILHNPSGTESVDHLCILCIDFLDAFHGAINAEW